ncbi:hypothetical protein HNV12_10300 [Methanococcoides sp. SA1]|nr:hypothetical protein [Methanococcoides sp. SA1]
MTLIVSKLHENNIYIESDSRITDPRIVRTNPLHGILKSVILTPKISLSGAGNVAFINDAIRAWFNVKPKNLNEFLGIINTIHTQSNFDTDFILAVINPVNIPIHFKFSQGQMESGDSTYWIGDYDAFSLFQQNWNCDENSELEFYSKFDKSFSEVINSENIDSVGDFQISVATSDTMCLGHKVFLYKQKMRIQIDYTQKIQIKKANEPVAIPLGSVAKGAYGISYLTSVSGEKHGVAIHFLHANFGVLFCPHVKEEKIIINDVNGIEFLNRIKNEYNLPMQGLVKISDTELQFVDTRN